MASKRKKNTPFTEVKAVKSLFTSVVDDFVHPIEVFFDLARQAELRTSTHQIMRGIFNLEIGVPRKVISQEPHPALGSH